MGGARTAGEPKAGRDVADAAVRAATELEAITRRIETSARRSIAELAARSTRANERRRFIARSRQLESTFFWMAAFFGFVALATLVARFAPVEVLLALVALAFYAASLVVALPQRRT